MAKQRGNERSQKKKKMKKRSFVIRAKSCVNIGEAFQQWRDLLELKCMKTDVDVLFLLDRWVTSGLLWFTEPLGQYCFSMDTGF